MRSPSENVLISKYDCENQERRNLKNTLSINQVIYISPNLWSVATFHH